MLETQKDIVRKKEKCDHQIDCMKLVQKIVDGQATDQEITQFRNNYDTCSPCEKAFALETCLKEAIQLKIDKKCVPSSILECIKQKIGH